MKDDPVFLQHLESHQANGGELLSPQDLVLFASLRLFDNIDKLMETSNATLKGVESVSKGVESVSADVKKTLALQKAQSKATKDLVDVLKALLFKQQHEEVPPPLANISAQPETSTHRRQHSGITLDSSLGSRDSTRRGLTDRTNRRPVAKKSSRGATRKPPAATVSISSDEIESTSSRPLSSAEVRAEEARMKHLENMKKARARKNNNKRS